MTDIASIKAIVEQELAKARKSVSDSEAGDKRNPDDPEWHTMVECYRDQVSSIERILAAFPVADTETAK